jgi:hypothetical protein
MTANAITAIAMMTMNAIQPQWLPLRAAAFWPAVPTGVSRPVVEAPLPVVPFGDAVDEPTAALEGCPVLDDCAELDGCAVTLEPAVVVPVASALD